MDNLSSLTKVVQIPLSEVIKTPMNNSKLKLLILSLIKDDITNTKLVNGFTQNGINASDYLLNISEVIFELLDINDRTDELFEIYLRFIQFGTQLDLNSQTGELDKLGDQIYQTLIQFKKQVPFPT